MVNYHSQSLDQSLYALSDPTRRAILARIAQGETTVSELAEPFDMSLAAVSKHLQVLERAKFLTKTKSGRTITCKATLKPLDEVTALLEELRSYWSHQLDSLEEFLANNNLDKKETKYGSNSKRSNTSGRRSKSHKSKKK